MKLAELVKLVDMVDRRRAIIAQLRRVLEGNVDVMVDVVRTDVDLQGRIQGDVYKALATRLEAVNGELRLHGVDLDHYAQRPAGGHCEGV